MPQTRTYKTGSIIYFEGDKAQYVYILKQGNLQSIHISIETGNETREQIRVGEFFGVKSVLGRYPCEETIQVLSDSTVLVLAPSEFEALATANTPIVIKMLKVFSNQLRRVNRKVRELLSEPLEVANPTAEIFKIGEFYYKSKQYGKAIYAYTKYISYAGNSGAHTGDAKAKLAECKSILGVELTAEDRQAQTSMPPPLIDDSILDTDFNFNETASEAYDMRKELDAGLALMTQNQTQAALTKFLEIGQKNAENDFDRATQERARFETAKCYLAMRQWDSAIQIFLGLVKQNPRADFVKEALVLTGKAHEGKGELDKAFAYFSKVSTLQPEDAFTAEAANLAASVKSKM